MVLQESCPHWQRYSNVSHLKHAMGLAFMKKVEASGSNSAKSVAGLGRVMGAFYASLFLLHAACCQVDIGPNRMWWSRSPSKQVHYGSLTKHLVIK